MIITASNLITSGSIATIKNGGVLVNQEGKIEKVDTLENLKKEFPTQEVKDYGDSTIMPGLMDMHVHMGYYYSQPDVHSYDDYMITLYALKQAKDAFSVGITTVRDMSSPHNLCKRLRETGEKGFHTVPRILHSDTGMTMTGGHGYDDGIVEVDGPWAIRKEIRKQARDGADWIKLLTSNRSHDPEFTQEELDAAVDECHRRRLKTAIHAGTHPAIQMCIDAGFDTIEHGTFMTVEQGAQMAEKGLSWVPTITAYTYLYEFCQNIIAEGGDLTNPISAKAIRDMAFFEPAAASYRDNFKKIYDTGVRVLAGSDMVLYGAPHMPIPKELYYMVEYGISPIEAIRTATVNPAQVLGLEEVTGRLEAGLEADILVVKGDAEKDITALNNVEAVYLGGKEVYTK